MHKPLSFSSSAAAAAGMNEVVYSEMAASNGSNGSNNNTAPSSNNTNTHNSHFLKSDTEFQLRRSNNPQSAASMAVDAFESTDTEPEDFGSNLDLQSPKSLLPKHKLKGQFIFVPQQQQQQQRMSTSTSTGAKELATPTMKPATANTPSAVPAEAAMALAAATCVLLPVEELIDRLHEVNRDATVYRNKRRQRRVPGPIPVHVNVDLNLTNTASSASGPRLLRLDDLTSVLKHINLSEAAQTPIRWDLIHQKTAAVYGENLNQRVVVQVDDHHNNGNNGRPRRRLHTNNNNDDMMDSSDDDDSGCMSTSPESTTRQIVSMMLADQDSNSNDQEDDLLKMANLAFDTRIEDCSDDDDDHTHVSRDGFSLDPSYYTCDSSVTWCECSLYEEVEVTTDDDITVGDSSILDCS
jgi:hypothetical protein